MSTEVTETINKEENIAKSKRLPNKVLYGSSTRMKRWLRNVNNMRDPNSVYVEPYIECFGKEREYISPARVVNPSKPSELMGEFLFRTWAPLLLDPYYKVDQLQTLYALCKRSNKTCLGLNKKHFCDASQMLFEPRIAMYLMFMSERDVFEWYLTAWRKYQPHKVLSIPAEMITTDMNPGCPCSGCFGACVRLAYKAGILPNNISHQQLMNEINTLTI